MPGRQQSGRTRIAGRWIAPQRLTLLPHEVGFLLEVRRSAIIAMLERGELRNASRDGWRRVAVEDAEALIERRSAEDRCSPLAELLLAEIALGHLQVSRAEASWLTLEAALLRRRRTGPANA